jgi:hypothetical protein
MNRRKFIAAMAALGIAPKLRGQIAQHGICQPVLKRGYDNFNSGCNLAETTFTQVNVAARGIKQLFTLPMEGDRVGAEAQPLIAPSVAVDDGTTRDLCITCSMNGLVYAFDANDSDIIWVKKLSVPVTGTRAIDAWQINDHWSALSTPVIDPATNRIYIVAWTDANGNAPTAYYQMHVLNLKDGSRVCPPVSIEGTSNGQTWNKMMRKQRSSLIQVGKSIYFAAGTVQETGSGAAGWIFAFDTVALKVKYGLALTNGEGAGVWMGGSSMVSDGGYLYAVTGNGGFSPPTNFGECVIKVQDTGSALKVVDWWSPWSDAGREGLPVTTAKVSTPKLTAKLAGQNASTMQGLPVNAHAMEAVSPNMAASDEDLGSGGMLMVGSTLIVSGKDGVGYVLNSQNMGKTVPSDFANAAANYAKLLSPPLWLTFFPGFGVNAAPQDPTQIGLTDFGKTHHMHSCPVSFNSSINGQTVFVWGENGCLRAWGLKNGALTFLAQGNEFASPNVATGMPGGFMCLSANGSVAGTVLLWAIIPYGNANETVTNGRLLVYDPEHFANGVIRVLWDSQAEEVSFLFPKFNAPVVSGGKLFLPTYGDETIVMGLA